MDAKRVSPDQLRLGVHSTADALVDSTVGLKKLSLRLIDELEAAHKQIQNLKAELAKTNLTEVIKDEDTECKS